MMMKEPAVCHILHSTVKEGITKEDVVNKLVLKQRKIVTKHIKSYVVKYGLQKAQKSWELSRGR